MVIPKVSVIVTIYNREKYIEECARTLFEQTLDDIEYLFIDDASTDRSVIILKNLLDKYPKRQLTTKMICLKQNSGRAVARQTGIDSASGEYVIHVDSDDWVDLDMFEKLYCKAKETNADIVGCNITHEYKDYQQTFRQKYSDEMDENIRNKEYRRSIKVELDFVRWTLKSDTDEDGQEKKEGSSPRKVLEKHFEVITLSYPVKRKHRRSWAYINYMQIGQLVIVPQLRLPEDELALEQIKAVLPECKVLGVPALEAVRKGGALNCVSWNLLFASHNC